MTLTPDYYKNAAISVNEYIRQNLNAWATDFAGFPFDSKSYDVWIQPRLLGPTSAATRKDEQEDTWILNVNCFAHTGLDKDGNQRATAYRHLDAAGEVAVFFNQVDVPLRDWDDVGDPIIGYLRFEEADVAQLTDVEVAAAVRTSGGKTDLQQATVTIAARLIL